MPRRRVHVLTRSAAPRRSRRAKQKYRFFAQVTYTQGAWVGSFGLPTIDVYAPSLQSAKHKAEQHYRRHPNFVEAVNQKLHPHLLVHHSEAWD